MTQFSRRRPSPGPVNAPAAAVEALHTYLLEHPQGLTWPNLVVGLRQGASPVAIALAGALDAGLVRVDCSGAFFQYVAADHFPLPAEANAVADAIVSFIAVHEDEERGSPDVTLALEKIVVGLAPRYSALEVMAGVELLRQEALVWFHALNAGIGNGLVSLTLSRHQYCTVVAHDGDAHQSLCFHVRAGNKEVALRKVRESAYGSLDELAIFGVTQGWVDFEQAPGHSGMLVERL